MPRRVQLDGGSGEEARSFDEVLEILSNFQRRTILQHLRDAPGHVHSIDEAIDHLRDVERERHGEPPGEDHLLAVLVHVHGPKLEEAGLVDYDVTSREIRYHPNEAFERVLERIETTAEEFEEA